ncbi:MAG: hypothetical protein LBD75_06350 [Candidatus Peribacteria bacterium]|nr:hypothetical protein [Candidatus Peribacteria bacterium]
MLQKRYEIERELKTCFFAYISLIESAFKNALCYYTCRTLIYH